MSRQKSVACGNEIYLYVEQVKRGPNCSLKMGRKLMANLVGEVLPIQSNLISIDPTMTRDIKDCMYFDSTICTKNYSVWIRKYHMFAKICLSQSKPTS